MVDRWEKIFEQKVRELDLQGDPAHDLAHFKRVVATAKRLCVAEGGRLEVVLPAAWLHDFVNVPKNDPRRAQASRLSAVEALQYLESIDYPREFFEDIAHAIEAHSFSAKIEPRTLEAKIVQDADRLDGLGAIGIARVFSVSGSLGRSLYHFGSPFAGETRVRELDDREYAVDHFYVKLFRTAETLQTAGGREEGRRRVEFMRGFLRELGGELK